MESEVVSAITSYDTNNLGEFEKLFRHSQVTRLVDDANVSVLSNTTNVTLGKFFTPTTTASASYYIYFNNALYNPHSGHNSALVEYFHQQDFLLVVTQQMNISLMIMVREL